MLIGGSDLLRLATTLCATAVLAACTAPVIKATTTPGVQTPSMASPFTRAQQEAASLDRLPAVPMPHGANPPVDHSGQKVVGKASFYARRFEGKKMSDGRRLNPATNVAASKTLPIGTIAKVINLDTGKSTTVTVEDHGPHVGGRVLDVSPKVAETLGMKKSGIANVVVKPVVVPQQDGGLKLGAGAADMTPAEVAMLMTSRVPTEADRDPDGEPRR